MFQSIIKSLSLGLTALVLSFFILGCDDSTEDSNNSNSSNGHAEQVTNILFAHGLGSSTATWDYFSQVTAGHSSKAWSVYRTNVAKSGTIIERASSLADYINEQNITEDSLLVVGHSMGGLDLRYIISEGNQEQTENNKYYQASKKIHKFYTIATPHKGSEVAAGFVANDNGAIHDLTVGHMTQFNIQHPYSHSSVNSRDIPMLAYRFACQADELHDGVVELDSQVLNGAPYTQEVISGKHTSGLDRICDEGTVEELLQTRVIDEILSNNTPRETI